MKARKLPFEIVTNSHVRLCLWVIVSTLVALTVHAEAPRFGWVAQGGGPLDDFARGIAADPAGNTYVTGSFHGLANFGSFTLSSTGGYDVFVAKYDNAGNVLWANQGGSSMYDDYGLAITADAAGNCYVTGAFSGQATFGTNVLSNVGGSDIFVAKYDTLGNLMWINQAGGISLNSGRAIAVDAAGNCYVTGVFQGTGPFGSTNLTAHSVADNDIFVAKYDPTGNLVWVQQAGGTLDDVGFGIAVDPGGESTVTGYFKSPSATFGGLTLINNSPTNSPDIFVVRYDGSGNVVWATNAGGMEADYGYAIALDPAGNSYVSGVFSGVANFGSVSLTNNGPNHFIAKYSSLGNVLWAQILNGGPDDGTAMVAADAAGNSYYTGWFSGTARFGTTNLTSFGLDDLFVAKFDTAGHQLWVKQAGGPSYDRGYGIAVDSFGNSYVAGFFTNTANFDSISLNGFGGYDAFVASLEGPRLAITRLPGQVVVSWPTNAAGLGLQITTNLLSPSNWTFSTNSPSTVGEQYSVTNSASASRAFYRLKNL